MAPLTLKVNLNGVHRMEGGGVIGDTWPSLSVKPPERQCEVLGSGGGKAEGPWEGAPICLKPPSLGLRLPSSSWALRASSLHLLLNCLNVGAQPWQQSPAESP